MGFPTGFFLFLLSASSVLSQKTFFLSPKDSTSVSNFDITRRDSLVVTSSEPDGVVELFLIYKTEDQEDLKFKEQLSKFPVYDGKDSSSARLGTLADLQRPGPFLTPFKSSVGSKSLSIYNHAEKNDFSFQLFFKTSTSSFADCSRVTQSGTKLHFTSPPTVLFCSVTILSFGNGSHAAGPIFDGLSFAGNGTAIVVPGVDFDTPNYFFQFRLDFGYYPKHFSFSESNYRTWANVPMFGKAVSLVLPPNSTIDVIILKGGFDITKDEIEMKNSEGFLTNPEYPNVLEAAVNFISRLRFPPSTEIRIQLADVRLASNSSLTLGTERLVGNQSQRTLVFRDSPLLISFVRRSSDPEHGFLLRYSVVSAAPTLTAFSFISAIIFIALRC
ncbi:hypothetical protein L596_008121 [Steinernema carpocapsae]|uniref:CUB domain-containing protein n=1 Tax=Steinernema carpocapsae TaxID=34508 RepID=A0A4U5PBK5_STECR|nr:hypothetical protein L596_008121 [Steinernema carpocapsae]